MSSIDVEAPAEQSTASLVTGILGDVQQLVQQQLLLTRREIEEDLRRRASAAKIMVVGAVVLLLGSMVLCLTVVHCLHWCLSPAGTDPASLPLWGCYAVVTGLLVIIGSLLIQLGLTKCRSIEPLTNPFREIIQEPVP